MPSETLELALTVQTPDGRTRLDVALQAPPGMTVLFGPSGAGKSTCLLALAGLLRPTRGRVVLAERVLFDSSRAISVPAHARRVALVFQGLALFPHLTVLQNVSFGIPRELSRAERHDLSVHWLTRMHIAKLAERKPDTLSGGEAQRVALARALAARPALLLLDEPFSALDHALRRELALEVTAMVSELRIPALLVTHDRDDAQTLAPRIVRLRDGRLDSTDERDA